MWSREVQAAWSGVWGCGKAAARSQEAAGHPFSSHPGLSRPQDAASRPRRSRFSSPWMTRCLLSAPALALISISPVRFTAALTGSWQTLPLPRRLSEPRGGRPQCGVGRAPAGGEPHVSGPARPHEPVVGHQPASSPGRSLASGTGRHWLRPGHGLAGEGGERSSLLLPSPTQPHTAPTCCQCHPPPQVLSPPSREHLHEEDDAGKPLVYTHGQTHACTRVWREQRWGSSRKTPGQA